MATGAIKLKLKKNTKQINEYSKGILSLFSDGRETDFRDLQDGDIVATSGGYSGDVTIHKIEKVYRDAKTLSVTNLKLRSKGKPEIKECFNGESFVLIHRDHGFTKSTTPELPSSITYLDVEFTGDYKTIKRYVVELLQSYNEDMYSRVMDLLTDAEGVSGYIAKNNIARIFYDLNNTVINNIPEVIVRFLRISDKRKPQYEEKFIEVISLFESNISKFWETVDGDMGGELNWFLKYVKNRNKGLGFTDNLVKLLVDRS